MEERRSSSTAQNLRSTGSTKLLAFPESRPRGFRRPSGTAEKTFNAASILLLVLFAMGWSWSIARARATGEGGVTPATARIATALTQRGAPSTAYLTDAALAVLATPARGASGKLRVRIQQPGKPISPILADTLPAGSVTTFSSGADAQTTAGNVAPGKAGIWSMELKIGNAIKPLADFQVITLRPAADKKRGRLGLYYTGNWMAAKQVRTGIRYEPPAGFIEVTAATPNTRLSDHFRL